MTKINEKQLVTLDPRASGVMFTITASGLTTAPIAVETTPSDVRSALQTTLGLGNVSVTGSYKTWVVEFTGALGGAAQPLLIVNGVEATVTVLTSGASLLNTPLVATPPLITPPAASTPEPVAMPATPSDLQSGFDTGSGKINTTPQPLGVLAVRKSLVIRANGSNTGVICVGNSPDNAAEGYILGKGETTPPIYVDDLQKVFLVGSANAQGYSWIAT